MFGLKRRGVSAAPLRYSGCAPVTVTPPALAASPDAADGEECDSSDDEPHDDVVHSAPPFCSSEGPIPPDAAHYAPFPFPHQLEIQQKLNSVPSTITSRRPTAAEVPFELSLSLHSLNPDNQINSKCCQCNYYSLIAPLQTGTGRELRRIPSPSRLRY